MSNLKIAVYGDGGKLSCPHCNSIQVKAMRNQPKKYPEPKMYWHSNKKEVEELKKVWDSGYDCKKCGNEFIALKMTMTPSWEQGSSSTTLASTIKTKKKSGFFGKLIKYSLIFIVALIIISIALDASKNSNTDDNVAPKEGDKVTATQDLTTSIVEEDPLKQEFSKEAEEAAHAYIPPVEEPQKSISDSQDQSDTLSIKTTLRENNE